MFRRDAAALPVRRTKMRLVHFTTPEAAASIRRQGFLERYRNPVLFGFSFARMGETWAKGHRGDEPIFLELDGGFLDPSGPDDRPADVYRGTTASPRWNALVDSVAQRVGLDWDAPPDARRRKAFADALRVELRRMGVDAVQVGREIVVVDPTKLRVLEKRWWGGYRPTSRDPGAARFMVATPKVLERASVYGGGRTVIEFQPNPYYGVHATNVSAKRRFVEEMIPDLRGVGASDDMIKRQFNAMSRNQGLARIIRLTPSDVVPTSRDLELAERRRLLTSKGLRTGWSDSCRTGPVRYYGRAVADPRGLSVTLADGRTHATLGHFHSHDEARCAGERYAKRTGRTFRFYPPA